MSKRKASLQWEHEVEEDISLPQRKRHFSPSHCSDEPVPTVEVVGVPYADSHQAVPTRLDFSPPCRRRRRTVGIDIRDGRRRHVGVPCWTRELHRPSTWPPEEVKAALDRRAFMKMSLVDMTSKIASIEQRGFGSPHEERLLRSYKDCLNKLVERYRASFPELEPDEFAAQPEQHEMAMEM